MENAIRKPCIFNSGVILRVSKHKITFEKPYETNWTEELFVVQYTESPACLPNQGFVKWTYRRIILYRRITKSAIEKRCYKSAKEKNNWNMKLSLKYTFLNLTSGFPLPINFSCKTYVFERSFRNISFYVTLPSISSANYFQENKISHFISKLPTSIYLKGEWGVRLSGLVYRICGVE